MTPNFAYIAQAPWPVMFPDDQLDWVQAVDTMEQWLTRYIGTQHSEWCYSTGTSCDYWQVCIAFKQARSKTLFLLQWS